MSIHRMNEIGRDQGRDAALAYAEVAKLPYSIRQRLKTGDWSFDSQRIEVAKSEPKPVQQAKHDSLQPIRTMPARIGKTAKSGGLAA